MKSRRVISREVAAELDLSSRIRMERAITDGKARQFDSVDASSLGELESYSRHAPWRRWMFEFLGSPAGKIVLDLGCGYHPTPIYLAAAGAAKVYACDISPNAVAHIQRLASQRGLSDRVVGIVCAAESLPFRDGEIDLIHGEAVLHHLALPLAAREIGRVLTTGGRAVFKDPLGQNRLLELARDYLKESAKATDRPLTFAQLDEFARTFRSCTYRGFGLAAIPVALGDRRRWKRLAGMADRLDATLLRRVPWLQRYCQYVVTCVNT